MSKLLKTKWISCEEKYPKHNTPVFVCCSGGFIRQAICDMKYSGHFKEPNCGGFQCVYSVTHWAPIQIDTPDNYPYDNLCNRKRRLP